MLVIFKNLLRATIQKTTTMLRVIIFGCLALAVYADVDCSDDFEGLSKCFTKMFQEKAEKINKFYTEHKTEFDKCFTE